MFFLYLFILNLGFASFTPHFSSLRAKKSHLHVGPGLSYPVEWVYVKPFFPIQIIASFDTWKQIRDPEGTIGWVHKSLLSSKRFVMIIGGKQNLFIKPDTHSSLVAILDLGVIAKLLECKDSFCKIEVSFQGTTLKGWIQKSSLWGV